MKLHKLSKYHKLVLGVAFDAIGYIPFIDLVWAPLSGYLMANMYKGRAGKIAGVISFIEELMPGLDVIPTFTIMWFYTFIISKEENIIEIK
jgi:hypothetical protein